MATPSACVIATVHGHGFRFVAALDQGREAPSHEVATRSLWAKLGETERARWILDEARGESVDRHALALGHLALGDVDAAFAAVEAGIEDHDPLLVESLRAAEWWSGIRGDPRYRKVIELLEREETHTSQ